MDEHLPDRFVEPVAWLAVAGAVEATGVETGAAVGPVELFAAAGAAVLLALVLLLEQAAMLTAAASTMTARRGRR
jgi:hypothetical protein